MAVARRPRRPESKAAPPRRARAVPEPTERVRVEWLRRVEAEYRSAALTQHLTLWLIQIGASPDLIHDGLRIVADELAHAELSFEAYRAAGGGGTPHLARETLALTPRVGRAPADLDDEVLLATTELFCLGETVAVRLFKVLRAECVAPAARRALDRVLRDEVRHREFGWTTLAWLLDHPAAAVPGAGRLASGDAAVPGAGRLASGDAAGARRALVERALPGMLKRQRGSYAPAAAQRDSEAVPAERAWGLMPSAWYGGILDETLERDYRPRFAALGIALGG